MDNRPPPQDLEAERAVLCACLIRAEIIPQVAAALPAIELYLESHQVIAQALYDLGPEADLIQLLDRLKATDKLDEIGGRDYLSSMIDTVDTSAGWRHWARIVHGLYQRRQVIIAAADAITQAHGNVPLDEALSTLTDSLRAVQGSDVPVALDNVKTLGVVIDKAESKAPLEGIKTGFLQLDYDRLGMLEPGTTCYLAARPSIGKTALALAIIDNVLQDKNQGAVILYSMEMTGEAIMRRRLSAGSGVYLSRLRHGNVVDSQWPNILEAAGRLAVPHPIIIDNPKFKRVERLMAYSQAVAQNKKVSLIVVDHIQKMSSVRKSQSRHHELSYVSERLCDLAKDLHCPVIILCQLRRPPNESKDRRPQLEMMKESGDLEANADVVLGLYREDKQATTMEVSCLKNRDGAAGWTGYLEFDPWIQRFVDGREPEQTSLAYKDEI